MTVSALQTRALEACLREQPCNGNLQGLAQRFFPRAAKAIVGPWTIAVGEDFRYPETTGVKARGTDTLNWYIANVHRSARHDPEVYRAFLRVMHLLRPPTSLLSPRIALRVTRGSVQSTRN